MPGELGPLREPLVAPLALEGLIGVGQVLAALVQLERPLVVE